MGDVGSWTITPRNNRAKKGVQLVNFYWITLQENVFHTLLQQFRKENFLTNFNVNEETFIFQDAHKTGFSARSAPSVNFKVMMNKITQKQIKKP